MGDRAIAEAITEEEGRALSCISLTRSWQGIGTEMRASLIRRGLVKDDGNTLLLSSEAEDAVSLYPLLGREGKAETYPGSFHEMLLSGSGQIKEMEEAAIIDGASLWQIFTKIYVPLSKPILSTVTIMTIYYAWNEFLFATILVDSSSLRTIPVGLMVFRDGLMTEWGVVMAGMVISCIPLIIVYLCMSRNFIRGLTAGAVKG